MNVHVYEIETVPTPAHSALQLYFMQFEVPATIVVAQGHHWRRCQYDQDKLLHTTSYTCRTTYHFRHRISGRLAPGPGT